MPNWTPKFLCMKDGKPALRSAITEHEEEIVRFLKDMLGLAAESKCAKPIFSGFHVRGINTTGGIGGMTGMVASGNVEYGYCQALHNEEAAVAALISQRGSTEFPGSNVIMIVAGKGKGSLRNFTAPCGNCRDILRDVIGENCLLVSGTEDGGIAIVARLSDCLFDQYAPMDKNAIIGLVPEIKRIFRKAAEIQDNPYNNLGTGQRFPLRNYYAQIFVSKVGEDISSFVGAVDVPADFHPLYPIEDALRAAKRDRALVLKGVKVVSFGTGTYPPDVMYRDRQRLLEAALDTELLIGEPCNPEVLLVTVDMFDVSKITGAWRTTVKEWLPFPFSPRNFGSEFLEDRRQKLKEKTRL